MASSSSVEPMSEAERNDMLKLIERRKNDLLEKKKKLEGLSKAAPKKLTTATSAAAPGSLLEGVMNAMSEAQTAAAQRPAETSAEPENASAKEIVDTGARYSRALKKVVGPLSATSGAVQIAITPRVIDRFDKSCQCESIVPAEQPSSSVPTSPLRRPETNHRGWALVTASLIKKKSVSVTADVALQSQQKAAAVISRPSTPLSEEEKKKLIYSSGFSTFFQKAGRLVERALEESELFDVFADYSQLRSTNPGAAERVRCLGEYVDDRWTPKRSILDIKSHPKFNELLLVSYAQKAESTMHDPDGCALVWNISMPKRAEYVFSCQSQVCTAQFDTYRPNNVIGGTFTGSIVLWDTRAKTRPVQRTPLTSKSHHHPIYSMQLVGTEHAHNLVSVDLDGRLCLWTMSMLVHPTETLELKKGGKDVGCMCIDFAEGENNSFLGGAEDGSLFQAQIHGSKAGLVDSYAGHAAPVTSLHWHPTEGKSGADSSQFDCCDVLLSSSLDWSVKLWSPKSHTVPLHSFQASDDYCMDVEWHPHNPAVFASSYADGALSIWDISKDLEVPLVTQSTGHSAVTRLKWSNDGCRITTGDSSGIVKIWGVSHEISQAGPEDRSRLTTTIGELKAAAQEQRNE